MEKRKYEKPAMDEVATRVVLMQSFSQGLIGAEDRKDVVFDTKFNNFDFFDNAEEGGVAK